MNDPECVPIDYFAFDILTANQVNKNHLTFHGNTLSQKNQSLKIFFSENTKLLLSDFYLLDLRLVFRINLEVFGINLKMT